MNTAEKEIIKENLATFIDLEGIMNYIEQLLEEIVAHTTRVEIIDSKGRSYVNWDENNKVELSFQDDDRTLKIFINKKKSGSIQK